MPAETDSALGEEGSPTDSARRLLWSVVKQFARTRAELFAAKGRPMHTSTDTVHNAHEPRLVDTVVALTYRGLEARFYVSADGREIPFVVTVTDSSAKVPLPLGIGSRLSDLEHYLGKADLAVARGDSLFVGFLVPPADQDQLGFMLVNGAVARIEWSRYID